jgi:PAS domain S-box-containing protein
MDFRQALETIPAVVVSALPDGSVDFVSQSWLDYTGLAREQWLGSGWMKVTHPEDLDRAVNKWQAALAGGEPVEVETRLRRADGKYRWFLGRSVPLRDEKGKIVKWYSTITDIDDRKGVEEKLRQSEAYLHEAERLGHMGSHAHDLSSRITFASPELLRIFGHVPDPDGPPQGMLIEVRDRNAFLGRIHPEDRHSFDEMDNRGKSAKTDYEMDYRIVLPDGSIRHCHTVCHPVFDRSGNVVEYIGTTMDVTERNGAEESLRRAKEALAHITRVTTMGELTASIAHEVNQPLTAIINNANACLSLLPNDAPNLEEVREALTEIIDDADRASAVIARVRLLARNTPSEKTNVDLRDVITDVLGLTRHDSAVRRIVIRAELPEALPAVLGDRVQLQQVLLNLVVNGMDAMSAIDESKRVLIICVCQETRNGKPEALLIVRDAGTGLKPEQLDRLFKAFYTTKPQGMGLGLAISRSIIEAHGGRLWAEPNQGPGATFLFSLPAAGEAAS